MRALLAAALALAVASREGGLLSSALVDGTWQILRLDRATGESRVLTRSPLDKRTPFATPGGGFGYRTSDNRLVVVRPDGTESPLGDGAHPVKDAAFSPDGKRVVFARFRSDVPDASDLCIASADGGDARVLVRGRGVHVQPCFSPSGDEIVYSAGHGIGTYEIYRMRVDGGEPVRLTNDSFHDFRPAWSPDGAWIAFTSDRAGNYEIWRMRPDGSELSRLTTSPGLDADPAFSPDGKSIAFTTRRRGPLEIWTMDADGSEPAPVSEKAPAVEWRDPAWVR